MGFKGILKAVFRYFLSGLLYTAPLVVTVFVIYKLFQYLDGLVNVGVPGLGILWLVIIVTLVGMLGSSFLLQPLYRYFTRIIDSIPLVKTIYHAIRDVLSAFVGEKRRFTKPVLVRVNSEGMQKMGFITSEDLSSLGVEEGKIAVYLPHSINFSGNLFVVDRSMVTALDANSADVMKFIVSGGVIEVDHNDSKVGIKDKKKAPEGSEA